MRISKSFLYPSIFLFSPDLCIATNLQDRQQIPIRTSKTMEDDSFLTKQHIEKLCLDLDKMQKSLTVYTSLAHYLQIHAATKNTSKTILIFKDFLRALKIRTILFPGEKAGINTSYDLDFVFQHLIQAKLLKITFNPEDLTLQVEHKSTEKTRNPKIVNDYSLIIQMELLR